MSTGSGKLQYALKTLMAHWDEVTIHWSDQVREDFEKNHLSPLEHRASAAIQGMDKLADVIKKVRQDCA